MIIELSMKREEILNDRTIGKFYDEMGVFRWFTLEDKDRKLESGGVKIYGQTAIPRGRYRLVFVWSPKRKGLVPMLLDVLQFTAVEIHIGNKPEDTEGCILLGMKHDEPTEQVIQSEIACSIFYPWLLEKIIKSQNNVWLTIS